MNEIDTVIRYMFDPGSRPTLDTPYEPAEELHRAEKANDAMIERLADEDLRTAIYDSTAEYGAACSVEAFDRGFRAGARMILQLLQMGGADACPTSL